MATGTRLIGRDAELAILGDAVARARDGIPVCVVIEGDAGIGKSRLLTEALAAYRDAKDHVALGHGLELSGGELPYGTIGETLRTLVRETGADTVRAAAGPYADQLAALCPPLGSTTAQVDRLQLLPGYVAALETLAEDRLVWLVVEDLHWVDPSSRDLLTYLVRVIQPCQLFTLLTVRSHDPVVDSGVADLVTTLTALDCVDRVALGPLNTAESVAMVTDLSAGSATSAQVDRVVSLAQGNPLLTEQLVAAGFDPTDERVTGPMATRIRALDPATRRLVQVASLDEEHLTHRLLAQAYDEYGFDTAVNTALEANLLSYDPSQSTYRFHHALLRHAAEASLRPSERRAGHRRWAELLTDPSQQRSDPRTVIAAAHHWAAAEIDDRAFDAALEASRVAIDLAGPMEAGTHLARVLALWDRVPDPEARAGRSRDDVIVDVTDSLGNRGSPQHAMDILDAELNRAGGDLVRTLCLRLIHDAISQADAGMPGDDGVYAQALAHADDIMSAPTTALTVEGLSLLGGFVRFTDPPMSFRLHERALEGAREAHWPDYLGRDPLRDVLSQLCDRGLTDQALALCTECRPEGQRTWDLFNGDVEAGLVLCEAGHLAEAVRLLDRGLSRVADAQIPNLPTWPLGQHIKALMAIGEWDRAFARLEGLARLQSSRRYVATFVAVATVRLACWRGDIEAAGSAAALARTRLSDEGDYDSWASVVTVDLEAMIAAAEGDAACVRAMMRKLFHAPGLDTCALAWSPLLTAARVEGDRAERAGVATDDETMEALTALRAATDTLPQLNDFNHARRLQAHADLNRAEGIDTVDDWSQAVEAWRRIGHRHHLGWALVRLANAHVKGADKDAATAPLTEAWDIAHYLGAVPLTDATVDLARRARIPLDTGGTPHGSRTQGRLSRLTSRELEVLRHVALGETNDELAAALYISPKTASVHVSRILAKLEVTSRAKATSIAYEDGLLRNAPE